MWERERDALEISLREAAKLHETAKLTAGSTRETAVRDYDERISQLRNEHAKRVQKLESDVAARDRDIGAARREGERKEEEGRAALEECRLRISSLQERLVSLEEDKRALSDRLGSEKGSASAACEERDECRRQVRNFGPSARRGPYWLC